MTILFKSPDAVWNAIENLDETKQKEVAEKLSKWIEWGEYIKVEFDLENMTAKVLPLK